MPERDSAAGAAPDGVLQPRRETTMRIRRAVPFALILALVAAGCDDGEEAAPAPDDDPPVTAEEIRRSAAPPETAAADPGADTAAGAAEDTAAPAVRESVPRTGTLYAVQVGAFVRGRNATDLRRRLEEAGLPTWTPTARVDGRSFRRVRVGAAETVTEARNLARRLRDRFGTDFWVAPVPPGEELPEGVIESTRAVRQDG